GVALRRVAPRTPGQRRRDVVAGRAVLLAGVLHRDPGAVRERRAGELEAAAPAAATSGELQPHDDVVDGARRTAVLVVVRRREPQPAVRRLDDGPQPAPLAVEERPRGVGRVALDVHDPQPRAADRGHVDEVVDDLDAAGRGRGDVELLHRVHEVGVAALAFADRPAVVLAGLDEVQLVEGVLTQFGLPQPALRVPGETLHVAVAEAVHPRCGRERVARRALPGRRDAQDLAVQRVEVLRQVAVLGVAGA